MYQTILISAIFLFFIGLLLTSGSSTPKSVFLGYIFISAAFLWFLGGMLIHRLDSIHQELKKMNKRNY